MSSNYKPLLFFQLSETCASFSVMSDTQQQKAHGFDLGLFISMWWIVVVETIFRSKVMWHSFRLAVVNWVQLLCVCACIRVWERERERENLCVCWCVIEKEENYFNSCIYLNILLFVWIAELKCVRLKTVKSIIFLFPRLVFVDWYLDLCVVVLYCSGPLSSIFFNFYP